jgi:hypothetical protein
MHPGGGCRERDLETIVASSPPAAPKETTRDEAPARVSDHSRRLPHRGGKLADGRFTIGDAQQDAQVDRTQMFAMDQFQEAFEGHGPVLARERIVGGRERACRRFEVARYGDGAGRRRLDAPS